MLSDPLDKTATLTLWDSRGKRRCPKWGIRHAVIFPLCLLSGDRSLACDCSCWIIGERKGKRRGCKSDVLWHTTEAGISATMLFVMFCQLLFWSWTTFIIFGISNTSNILGQGKYLTAPVQLIHPRALKSCSILVKYCHTQVVGGMVPAVKVRRVVLLSIFPWQMHSTAYHCVLWKWLELHWGLCSFPFIGPEKCINILKKEIWTNWCRKRNLY